jgi:hypothetical protein
LGQRKGITEAQQQSPASLERQPTITAFIPLNGFDKSSSNMRDIEELSLNHFSHPAICKYTF